MTAWMESLSSGPAGPAANADGGRRRDLRRIIMRDAGSECRPNQASVVLE